MTISTVTQVGRALNSLAAQHPQAISVREVLAAIDRGTIFEVLAALHPDTIFEPLRGVTGDEFSLTALERDRLLEAWASAANAHGVLDGVGELDGVALLLAYVFLGMHDRRSDFLIGDEQRGALLRIQAREGVPAAEQVQHALAEWLSRREEHSEAPA